MNNEREAHAYCRKHPSFHKRFIDHCHRVIEYEPDPELRDYENVPLKEDIDEYMQRASTPSCAMYESSRLKEDIDEYMQREGLPHVPDAWVDESKTKIGYEINFNRYFYQYTPPRPLDEIETDLKRIEGEIADMLAEVTE